MSRGVPLSRRLARLPQYSDCSLPAWRRSPPIIRSSRPRRDRSSLVDDAQTANPELVEVAVADPAGFGVSGQTLRVPPGYTVSVVAAGLGGPRFMAFDDDGQSHRRRRAPGHCLPLPVRGRPARGAGSPLSGAATAGECCHLHGRRRPVPLRRRGESGQPLSLRPGRTGRRARSRHSRSSHGRRIARGRSPSAQTGCSISRSDRPATSASRRSRSAPPSPGPIRTGAIWRSSPPGCATRSDSTSNRGPICSGRRSTSATTRATRSRPIWSRSSKRARTMAGRPACRRMRPRRSQEPTAPV